MSVKNVSSENWYMMVRTEYKCICLWRGPFWGCLIYVWFIDFRSFMSATIKWSCSHTEKSRSACFGWHNFIWTGIKYEILLYIFLFGLALFFKFLILTCLFKKISASPVLTSEGDPSWYFISRSCSLFITPPPRPKTALVNSWILDHFSLFPKLAPMMHFGLGCFVTLNQCHVYKLT